MRLDGRRCSADDMRHVAVSLCADGSFTLQKSFTYIVAEAGSGIHAPLHAPLKQFDARTHLLCHPEDAYRQLRLRL